MPTRSASVVWEGSSREGAGRVKLGSGAFEGPYSWPSRFQEAEGTNPEELLGAAHAACFSMALASNLAKTGNPPQSIHTTAHVQIDRVGEAWKITTIELNTAVRVAGIDEQVFQQQAEAAKKGCPVSQALTGVEIKLNARLMS
jgi:lipoyl-dependent peroxiredoxin